MKFIALFTIYFLILIIPNHGLSQGNESIREYIDELSPFITVNKYLIDAQNSLEVKNLSNAISDYENVITTFPQYDRAYIQRGIIKTMFGDYEEAISDFSLAIIVEPNSEFDDNSLMHKFHLNKNAKAYFYRGQANILVGNQEKANLDFSSSRKINEVTYEHLRQGKNIGDLIREKISNHVLTLHQKRENKFKISNRVDLVRNNPTVFDSYILPEDLVQYDEFLEVKINDLYSSNLEFRKLLIDNQIAEFDLNLKKILKSRSAGIFDPALQPEIYAKLFAIFNRFGLEALKDYTNILQHYVPGARAQDNKVISAFRRFRDSPQYQSVDVFDYAKEFTRFN